MKRILLKISGEAFSHENNSIVAGQAQRLAQDIAQLQKTGIELVVVLGGGNIYRGSKLIAAGVDPSDSHNMSMLSTVFNAVTLKNFLEKEDISCVIMDALGVEFLESYTAIKAREYIDENKIVICSSGTGTPFFTTDTTGVLRALETNCDAMIKLTKVDGVYESDPLSNPTAKKYDYISYNDFISHNLQVLDQTGIIMARDNNLPIYVASLGDIKSLESIIAGTGGGTQIS